jgi:diguanylate cyclase (GGDEF)-like protein
LTGVANRRRFDEAFDEEWRRGQRAGTWLSLAIADVDHFKRFNDRHGHLAGDERLRRIAASLTWHARRAGDLVARFGGEEFALILPGVDSAMMAAVLRNLICGVSAPETEGADGGPITVSIGAVSVVPTRGATAREALAVADDLLYAAKHEGRDRAVHMDLATRLKTVVRRS